jgi:hypothetical protein
MKKDIISVGITCALISTMLVGSSFVYNKKVFADMQNSIQEQKQKEQQLH